MSVFFRRRKPLNKFVPGNYSHGQDHATSTEIVGTGKLLFPIDIIAHVAGKHKPGNAGSEKTSGINTKTTRFEYFITLN